MRMEESNRGVFNRYPSLNKGVPVKLLNFVKNVLQVGNFDSERMYSYIKRV